MNAGSYTVPLGVGLWFAAAICVAMASARLIRAKVSRNGSTVVHVNRPLWKKLLLWTMGCIFWIPTSLLTGTAVLNYSGYCFEQNRYLTDEERIRHTVEVVLGVYPDITYAYDTLPKAGHEVVHDKSRCCGQGDASRFDGSSGGTALNAEQLILYRDTDEFFAVNPDCCGFARNGLYGELGSTELWPRLTGYSAGFVNVKFRVRYRDAAGKEQSKLSAVSWSYTTCGAPSARLLK